MLLTIKQPAHQSYTKSFHDYTPPTPPSSSRFSPLVAGLLPAASRSLPALSAPQPSAEQMSTPHRGLPLPPALTLPQPSQQQQQPPPPPPIAQPPLSQPLGQLPAPPQQWQGAEESMRNWLQAKAEEDKRKQEEEKTRQESLRLEQRKIEQDMLRTSLSGGIPPYMVPMVFAGMGGGNLPNSSLEWAQHYMAQTHQLQQQQQQGQQPAALLASQSYTSPEQLQRGDAPRPYQGQEHPAPMMIPSTPAGASSQQASSYAPGYQVSPTTSLRQLGSTGQPQGAHGPRLSTGELQIQPTPAGSSMPQVQQQQTAQQQESSPSIYFHHWQPPTTQAGSSSGNQPTTPPEPSSPKKRKATGPQQAAPPPTSQPQYTPTSFSQAGSSVSNTPSNRRRGHSRQRSDLGSRSSDPYGRPLSRQRHRHAEGSFSMTSPVREQQQQQQQPPLERQRPRGGSNPVSVSSILEYSEPRAQPAPPQQQHPPPRQPQHDPRYSAGPEMRHDERRTPPEEDSRRVKRDDARD